METKYYVAITGESPYEEVKIQRITKINNDWYIQCYKEILKIDNVDESQIFEKYKDAKKYKEK